MRQQPDVWLNLGLVNEEKITSLWVLKYDIFSCCGAMVVCILVDGTGSHNWEIFSKNCLAVVCGDMVGALLK